MCGLPVFLAEKLVVSRTLYHRTCFRCARCKNQLTPGNYYETEEGQFCCETCPDEETMAVVSSMHQSYKQAISQNISQNTRNQSQLHSDDVYHKPLSDEEKSEQFGLSAMSSKNTEGTPSQTQQMRLNFMTSHLLSENLNELSLVDDPETLASKYSAASSDSDSDSDNDRKNSPEVLSASPCLSSRISTKKDELDAQKSDPVNMMIEIDDSRSLKNQRLTAILSHDVDNKSLDLKKNTKDLLGETSANSPSLVQLRLKMFEGQKNDDVVRTWKGDSVKALILEKDSEFNEREREESSQSKNVEPGQLVESREEMELKDNTQFEEGLESDYYSSKISEDVADICATVGSLSSSTVKVQKNMIDDRDLESSNSLSADFHLLTTKGINLSDIEEYPEALNPFADEDDQTNNKRVSTNPFGSEDDEDPSEAVSLPQPAVRSSGVEKIETELVPVKRRLHAPQINLNPFFSDDDDEDEDKSDTEVREKTLPTGTVPVPKPRTMKQTEVGLLHVKADLERSGFYASNTSLNSCGSTPGGTYRKKKPAPQPPTKETLSSTSKPTTLTFDSSSILAKTSPQTTLLRFRKAKPAPAPPFLTSSTPQKEVLARPLSFNESSIVELDDRGDVCKHNMWEDQKSNKNEMNRNRQSFTCPENPPYESFTDKSVQGKWKRKKGPAPPRPIPHRRKIKVISMKDVKMELDEIELQQQGLERQGVRLEQIIRDKSESKSSMGDDSILGGDVEELVLELFVLVNEKNELFRRQAELMLLRRQQRLEEEHADVEYQVRCLMCQPEATKTDFDKQREEALIQRLVQIVERRNEIVECLEMDRRREVEEDRSISKHMGLYAAKFDTTIDNDVNSPSKTKKGKLKEKLKEKKLKKSHKKDADKDVDEVEVKLKRHTKRKWF